ncbi:MAG: zinc ribbon domain-containing protein [Acidimicrobiales bacterium]|nr:zinc ribbon domain-containing protein [Acidimicrobiales bacterium]
MPTYEYRCHDCETIFDHYQSFSDDSVPKCPGKYKDGPYQCTKTRKGKVTKVFGNVGIAFKGSGFYKTDHGSKKSNASSDSSSSSSSDSSSSSSSSDSSGSSSSDSSSSGSSTASSSAD